MNTESAIEGGISGATTLTILHEIVRQLDKNAPRMDEIGMQALTKVFKKINVDVPEKDMLYLLTTVLELITNGVFYSLVGAGNKENVWLRGSVLGLAAGIGAVVLPDKLGLDDRATNRTGETKFLTIVWYLIGGIVAAAVTQKIAERKENN